jgi:putrescine aminotransferase
MTIAKGLSSGYQPIGGSIISDSIVSVLEAQGGEFYHGYTYSGHPVAAAVALENIRILQEEKIIESVRDRIAPYLKMKWSELAGHPLVGEARSLGMLGALELSPSPNTRAPFKAEDGTAGLITRNICIKNGLIMRHVYDKMIISPPLIITKEEIDDLVSLVWKCLDEAERKIKKDGLMQIGTRAIETY